MAKAEMDIDNVEEESMSQTLTAHLDANVQKTVEAVKETASYCTPEQARTADFPVTPGAAMPAVAGCNKQDYAVLFVLGIEGPV